MSSFVLDCSVAIAWCFADESTPETDELQERLHDDGAIVPVIWPSELANVLIQSERRGRISAADAERLLSLFLRLPILVDDHDPLALTPTIAALARTHRLTCYDAAYLEVAIRRALPLATKDRALRAAATTAGLQVLPAIL